MEKKDSNYQQQEWDITTGSKDTKILKICVYYYGQHYTDTKPNTKVVTKQLQANIFREDAKILANQIQQI